MDETSDTPTAAAADQGEASSDPSPSPDGRTHRAERTRAAVVEALLTLNENGNPRPTAKEIAAEAGVSSRSLYVHFDDLEALSFAASERQLERLAAVMPAPVESGPLTTRLDAFIERRSLMLEFGAGVRKAAVLREPFSAVLRDTLNTARRRMRRDVERCFADELATAPEPGTLATAIDLAASSATWESMRVHHAMSTDEATAQMRAMIESFLNQWGPAGRAR